MEEGPSLKFVLLNAAAHFSKVRPSIPCLCVLEGGCNQSRVVTFPVNNPPLAQVLTQVKVAVQG